MLRIGHTPVQGLRLDAAPVARLYHGAALIHAGGEGPGIEDAYGLMALGIDDMVAYWRLGDAGTTLRDSSGHGYDGFYSGSPVFGTAPLTWGEADGKATDFNGAGHGEVAHNAAFALARGTLAFYFEPNSLASASTLVAKHGSGSDQFQVRVTTAGRLQLNFGSITVETESGVITAGVEYHCAAIWDQVAIHLLLDGREVGWSRGHTSGLVGNSLAWRFGEGNVVLDEVALYSRRLPWAETDALSEYIRGLSYDPTPASTATVSNASQLATAIAAAPPGRHILLNTGSYSLSGTYTFAGTKRNPVVVRPNGSATPTISGEFFIAGEWAVWDGLTYNNALVKHHGSSRYIRTTRGTFTNIQRLSTVRVGGYFDRVDHCDISNETTQTATRQGVRAFTPRQNHASKYALCDRCYFHDGVYSAQNGTEAFATGGTADDSQYRLWITLENCLFDTWYCDQELTSLKTMATLCRGNTIIGTLAGPPTADPGMRCHSRSSAFDWYESDWYENMTFGAAMRGYQITMIGCHGQNADLAVCRGDIAGDTWFNNMDPSGPGRPASYQGLLIGCTATGSNPSAAGRIEVGQNGGGTFPADFTALYDCSGVNLISGSHSNTNNQSGSPAPIPYTAAVKLTTSDVGPAAADPLVPAGWK